MAKELKYVLSADAQQALSVFVSARSELGELGDQAESTRQDLTQVGKVSATGKIPAEASAAAARLAAVGREADNVRGRMQKTGNQGSAALRMLAKAGQAVKNSLSGIGKYIADIGAKYAKWLAVGAVAAATAAGVATVKLGMQMEQTRLQIQTMMGDVGKGNALLAEFNEFANVTPFSNNEVITAGKTLLSFGVSAENVKKTLREVGDVAAGSGKDFTELAAIVGKVYAKGKADSEALNQMSEAGIPIVAELGKMYGVSGDKVYNMASKGQIGAAALQQAFSRMSAEGGIFANMMQKQSQTAGGMWSTVVGKLQLLGATLGEQLMPLLTVWLERLSGIADQMAAMAADGTLLVYVGQIVGVALGGLREIASGLTFVGGTVYAIVDKIISLGRSVFGFLIAGVSGLIGFIAEGITDVINGIISAYNWVIDKFGGEQINKVGYAGSDFMQEFAAGEASAAWGATKETFTDWSKFSGTWNAGTGVYDSLDGFAGQVADGFAAAADKVKNQNTTDAQGTAAIQAQTQTAPVQPDDTPKKDDVLSVAAKAVEVDNFAKIGLFNFGSQRRNDLDGERNNLLKQIIKTITNSAESGGGLTLTEV